MRALSTAWVMGGLTLAAAETEVPTVAPPTLAAAAAAQAPNLPPLGDPLKPINVVFFHFNDKLHYWVLKPAAQGYSFVVPKAGRVCVYRFLTHVATPARLVNSTLQLQFRDAWIEIERFGINTTVGVLGLTDPAADRWRIESAEDDLGLTLAAYGMHPWIYLNLPILGPSTPRDTLGLAGDSFLDPFGWFLPFWPEVGVSAYDRVNKTSLQMGEYEKVTAAAVDPYAALRDMYYRERETWIQEKAATVAARKSRAGAPPAP